MAISDENTAPEPESGEIPFIEDTQPLDVEDIPSPKSNTRGRKKSSPEPVAEPVKTEPVVWSKAQPGERRSLTVLHLQRKLAELGYITEADARRQNAQGEFEAHMVGRYGKLTEQAVADWQERRGEEPTGRLTHEQFEDMFKGDPGLTIDHS